MDPLIVNNLTKIFEPTIGWFSNKSNNIQQHIAINNISFSLKEAEIVGLLGTNGAGKSTLMHMLIGTLLPSSGTINYFGKDLVKNRSAILEGVAFASSCFRLAPSLTIMQNLNFFMQMYTLPNPISSKKIEDLLMIFGLIEHRHKKISDLSAGESNKVCILKAFLPDSKIILLDEPTAFLDAKATALIHKLIKEQRDKNGTTFFLTSHNQADIAQLCDRVLMLDKGQLQFKEGAHVKAP